MGVCLGLIEPGRDVGGLRARQLVAAEECETLATLSDVGLGQRPTEGGDTLASMDRGSTPGEPGRRAVAPGVEIAQQAAHTAPGRVGLLEEDRLATS